MDGFGERLRQRARELGLSDTEVARRLGLSQARYAHYVNDKREPDFRTFVNICRMLETSPDRLFGFEPWPVAESEAAVLHGRIGAAAQAMTEPTLRTAVTVMDALVRAQATD